MTIYDEIAAKIIKEQELLMGPIAWQEANKIKGLKVNKNEGIVIIEKKSDTNIVLNSLVDRFGNLFGRAGREVCKEAASALIADLEPSKVPIGLK